MKKNIFSFTVISKSIFFFLLFSLITQHSTLNTLFAQAPGEFNYQAVARDGNAVLSDATIDVRFDILQGDAQGTSVWNETHSSVTTNAMGLFSLKVGSVTTFTVDWTTGPYFLKVQLDLGSGLQDFGSAELLSVPYALHAANAGGSQTLSFTGTDLSISGGNTEDLSSLLDNTDTQLTEAEVDAMVANNGYLTTEVDGDVSNEIQDLVLSGDELSLTKDPNPVTIDLSSYADNPWTLNGTTSDTLLFGGSVAIGSGMPNGSVLAVQGDDIMTEEPLFEVKREDGITVFAVYNSGVRMYVEDGESKSRNSKT